VTPGGGEGFLVRGDRALSLRRSARAAAASLRRAAAALARTSWVAVPGFLDGPAGDPDRRTGPLVRFPAPVIVALSSPNPVIGSLPGYVLLLRGLRRAPPGQVRFPHLVPRGGPVIQEGGDDSAGLGDFLPVAAGQDRVVLGGADRQPVVLLPGRGVQPGPVGPVGQPAAAGRQRQADARLHACDDVG
jgi:hypothetical protein